MRIVCQRVRHLSRIGKGTDSFLLSLSPDEQCSRCHSSVIDSHDSSPASSRPNMNAPSVCWLLVVVLQSLDARWITGTRRDECRSDLSRSFRQSLLVDAVLEWWLVLRLGSQLSLRLSDRLSRIGVRATARYLPEPSVRQSRFVRRNKSHVIPVPMPFRFHRSYVRETRHRSRVQPLVT